MNGLEQRSLPLLLLGSAPVFAALVFVSAPWGEVPLALVGLAFIAPIAASWRLTEGELYAVRLPLLLGGLIITSAALTEALISSETSPFALNVAAAPLVSLVACWVAAKRRGRQLLSIGAACILAGLGAYSLLLWATGTDTSVGTDLGGEGFTRRIFPAAFGHPNQFAATLGMLLPLTLAMGLATPERKRRVALLGVTLIGGAALLFTYSRNFWIAVALALAIVCLTSRLGRILLAIGAVAVAALVPFTLGRFTETPLSGGRVEIWRQALVVIEEHPWAGIGLERFPEFSGGIALPDTADAPPHAHSLLLTTATELGVPAALAVLAILVTLIVALTRRILADRGAPHPLSIGCLGALVVIVVGGLFDAVVFHNVPTLMIAAAILGISAAVTARAPYGVEGPSTREGNR